MSILRDLLFKQDGVLHGVSVTRYEQMNMMNEQQCMFMVECLVNCYVHCEKKPKALSVFVKSNRLLVFKFAERDRKFSSLI